MLDPLRVNSLSKADTKKKLLLISTIADVLYTMSLRNFGDKNLSTKLAKNLNKMVANH